MGPITVPVCAVCHDGTAKDDEAFRDSLVLMAVERRRPLPLPVRRAVRASLNSAGSQFRPPIRDMLDRSRQIWVKDVSGLIQPGKEVSIDSDRIHRVAERIARGLYWHEHGEPVPAHADLRVIFDFNIWRLEPAARRIVNEIGHAASDGQESVIVDGVARFFRAAAPEDGRYDAWILEFYRCIEVLAIVGDAEEQGSIILPPK